MLHVVLSQTTAPAHFGGQDHYLELTPEVTKLTLWLDPEKYPTTVQGNFKRQARLQKLGRYCRGLTFNEFNIDAGFSVAEAVAFGQGFYDPNLTKPDAKSFKVDDAIVEEFVKVQRHLSFLRNLVNRTAADITPENLAFTASMHLKETVAKRGLPESVLHCQTVTYDDLLEEGLVGCYTVGKGSANKPCFLEVDFNPTGNEAEPVVLALVGKGITFDTGGLDLKPSQFMINMRSDMGGAALVTASLALAISQGLSKRVKLFLCCAENMVSSNSFRPSDIITYPNGVSAVVDNTDAEGRLVLADGLLRASKANHGKRPQYILNAATLTGAAKYAVGTDYHSVLSYDDAMVASLFATAAQVPERFWRLPLEEMHRDQVASPYATITNSSSVPQSAGASTAAGFLSHFVDDYENGWLHIDASATFNTRGGDLANGATGRGCQALAAFINKL